MNINRLLIGERRRVANADMAELLDWFGVPQGCTITVPGGHQIQFKLAGVKEAWATRNADGTVTLKVELKLPYVTPEMLDFGGGQDIDTIKVEFELGRQPIPKPVPA